MLGARVCWRVQARGAGRARCSLPSPPTSAARLGVAACGSPGGMHHLFPAGPPLAPPAPAASVPLMVGGQVGAIQNAPTWGLHTARLHLLPAAPAPLHVRLTHHSHSLLPCLQGWRRVHRQPLERADHAVPHLPGGTAGGAGLCLGHLRHPVGHRRVLLRLSLAEAIVRCR